MFRKPLKPSMPRFFMISALAAASIAAMAVLSACYPAFNWREVRPQGTALSILLPCKPDKAQKTVSLGGKPTGLTLLGCDAGDITFAIAVAELGNVLDAAPVLAQWQEASLGNMKAEPVGEGAGASNAVSLKILGASTRPPAVLVRARGQRADGRPVSGQAAYFAQGSQVFQAVVYADKIPQEVAETFFSSLKFE